MESMTTAHAAVGTAADQERKAPGRPRSARADGMIIDLAKDVFEKLAPLSQGVVQVTISW